MSSTRKFIMVSLSLVSLLFFPISSHALTESEKIQQLQAQIDQLEIQKKELQGTIAVTDSQAKTLALQIQNLKNQISVVQVQLQLTTTKINQTQIQITGIQGSIADNQTKIDYQKDTISQLLLYLHQRDQESLVGVLMKNANLSDYFDQEQYALSINTQLLKLIKDLKDTQTQLTTQKNDLQGKKTSLESLQKEESAQKASLASVQANKDQLLKTTKGQEALYQKQLVDVQNQESLFFSQLRELETHIIQGGLYIVHVTATAGLPAKQKDLFGWPEENPRVTQGYGCTSYARCNHKSGPYNGAPHNGVDMAAGFGSSIRAIADGIIVANGKNDGWGNWVAIQHPNNYNLVSIYAHMSALSFLQVGTAVTAGQVIGYEGNTGNAEGSHLHLSLYKDFFTYVNDKKGQLYFNYFEGTVNPLNYLP